MPTAPRSAGERSSWTGVQILAHRVQSPIDTRPGHRALSWRVPSMLRVPLAVALVAALALPAMTLAHDTLPAELEQFIEPLPDGMAPQPVGHDHDVHSDNMFLVANNDDGGSYRQGSDLAFWGNLAVLGNYDNPGGFRLMDIADPSSPTEVGQFVCRGPQADVSIWRDLV